ncbi:MAG: ABC transporter permease [Myxococcales bacterium]|nr:ABC transporter permease subunit [Myxococcales bacterium]HIK84298.1 ABC transporter permease subunit [Myxococcales bacterium]
MNELELQTIAEITIRTLWVCGCALLLALAIGIPIGIVLGSKRFLGRSIAVSTVNAGMGAPPVVVGLGCYILFARSGLFGGVGLIYSLTGMIIAQTLIAVPLVIGITLAAVGSLDDEWNLQVRTLGIGRVWRLWLLVREIRMGLLAAVIAALGGILSEVGASQMVGGNLDGKTRVLTTAIMMKTSQGQWEQAAGLAIVLMGLTLLVAGVLTVIQQSGRTR